MLLHLRSAVGQGEEPYACCSLGTLACCICWLACCDGCLCFVVQTDLRSLCHSGLKSGMLLAATPAEPGVPAWSPWAPRCESVESAPAFLDRFRRFPVLRIPRAGPSSRAHAKQRGAELISHCVLLRSTCEAIAPLLKIAASCVVDRISGCSMSSGRGFCLYFA